MQGFERADRTAGPSVRRAMVSLVNAAIGRPQHVSNACVTARVNHWSAYRFFRHVDLSGLRRAVSSDVPFHQIMSVRTRAKVSLTHDLHMISVDLQARKKFVDETKLDVRDTATLRISCGRARSISTGQASSHTFRRSFLAADHIAQSLWSDIDPISTGTCVVKVQSFWSGTQAHKASHFRARTTHASIKAPP